ncbi:MAG: alpha/beta hydrolase [Deltaproteobacteria bacterium]|nr:alpha/beta hydrolase [Deltaproteobacteria bacterium]
MKKFAVLLLSLILLGCSSTQEQQQSMSAGAEWERIVKSAGLIEKTTQIEKFKIYYHEGGKGETIVLLHGFGGNKEMWTDFAKFLTPEYHVIILDLPGHGKSTKAIEEWYTPEYQAERLDQFANALGLSKFHIAGNSMGGEISGEYAVKYPDRLLSVGLFNSGGIPSALTSEILTPLVIKRKNILIVTNREEYNKVLELMFVKIPPWSEERMEATFQKSISGTELKEKIITDIARAIAPPLEAKLSKIMSPTLILWGDKDRILDVSSTKIFEKGISNSKTVIMTNMGHCPQMERPEETAGIYIDFLESL